MSIRSLSTSNLGRQLWLKLMKRQILWRLLYFGLTTWILFTVFARWAYDDPYITYRYATNLAKGMGFVYNPGEQILSTTTPLFTLLLALLAPLPVDLPRLANLIGAASLSLGGLFLQDTARTWKQPLIGWAGLLLYPTFPLLLTTIGSETPLYLAFCLGAVAAYARRQYNLTAVFSALAILARPDGALPALILACDYLIRAWRKTPGFTQLLRSLPWTAIGIFFGLLLPWVIFAWSYFGSPIPVTLFAKQQQGMMASSQRFGEGLVKMIGMYAAQWFYWVEGALALVGLLSLRKGLKNWGIFLVWVTLYAAAYTLFGVNSYYWYYAPLVIGLIVLIGLGASTFQRLLPATQTRTAFILGFLFIGVLTLVQASNIRQVNQEVDGRTFAYRAVAKWLKARTPADSLVGCLEVGIIGYYSERPMIDFAGLLQPAIAAQIHPESDYTSMASWAIEHYHPSYLVLHEGSFPELEKGYVAEHCSPVQNYTGKSYNYSANLVIYQCES